MAPVFDDFFSEAALVSLFENRIKGNRSVGTDGQSAAQFSDVLDYEVRGIAARIASGSYSFSRYKQKLILKGPTSFPREIAIPSVRDALVLRALCDYLHTFIPSSITRPPHQFVADAFREGADNRFRSSIGHVSGDCHALVARGPGQHPGQARR